MTEELNPARVDSGLCWPWPAVVYECEPATQGPGERVVRSPALGRRRVHPTPRAQGPRSIAQLPGTIRAAATRSGQPLVLRAPDAVNSPVALTASA